MIDATAVLPNKPSDSATDPGLWVFYDPSQCKPGRQRNLRQFRKVNRLSRHEDLTSEFVARQRIVPPSSTLESNLGRAVLYTDVNDDEIVVLIEQANGLPAPRITTSLPFALK